MSSGFVSAHVKPSPSETIKILKAGNKRFVENKSKHPNSSTERFLLAGNENQKDYAYATVITCSDSRVPVELIFDAGVMDIFTIRVAGNVCNVDEIGSIEYGLAHVKTPLLVVLAHTQCGAVTAATHIIQGKSHELERNIPPLIYSIEPAVQRAMANHPKARGDEIIPYAIEENIWQGIIDLFTDSPTTRILVKNGSIKVIGAIYDVGSGKVKWMPESTVKHILSDVELSPKVKMNAMANVDVKNHLQTPSHKNKTQLLKGGINIEIILIVFSVILASGLFFAYKTRYKKRSISLLIEETIKSCQQIAAQSIRICPQIAPVNEKNIKGNLLDTSENIKTAKEMMSAINEINNSSDEIYKIMKIVGKIVSQTKFLALTVVAKTDCLDKQEKEIPVMTKELRNITRQITPFKTGSFVNEKIQLTKNSAEIASDTEKKMYELLRSIKRVGVLVNKISYLSENQTQTDNLSSTHNENSKWRA